MVTNQSKDNTSFKCNTKGLFHVYYNKLYITSIENYKDFENNTIKDYRHKCILEILCVFIKTVSKNVQRHAPDSIANKRLMLLKRQKTAKNNTNSFLKAHRCYRG